MSSSAKRASKCDTRHVGRAFARQGCDEAVYPWQDRCNPLNPHPKVPAPFADHEEMDLSATALQGLHQADTQLTQAASRIASYGATSPDRASLDTAALSAELVALMSARTEFSANLRTLQTANAIQKNLIDLTA